MTIRAVLMDFDGPINDSFHEGLERIRILLALEGIDYTPDVRRRLKEHWGLPGRELFLRAIPDVTTQEHADLLYRKWIVMDQKNPIPLIPGARSVLSWLHENNIPIGCVTMRDSEDIANLFDILDIAKYFSAIATKQVIDGNTITKPDPQVFEPIFRQFSERSTDQTLDEKLRVQFTNISPEDCLYVGDTIADVRAGWSNKMGKTLLVLTGAITPKQLETLAGEEEHGQMHMSDVIRDIEGVIDWVETCSDGTLTPYYRSRG